MHEDGGVAQVACNLLGRGGPHAALSVWVTKEQEGLKGKRLLLSLLLFYLT